MNIPTNDPHAPYTVYTADMSYFSGKFEAYLRYKEIPYQAVDVNFKSANTEIYQHTGFKKVPAVRTDDDLWLFDTTPMMQWFEQRYTQCPILPSDPALAFVALLLEDYGDEWLWRPSMWWRWQYRASRLAAGWRIGALAGFGGVVVQQLLSWQYAFRQRREWLWGDGVTRQNKDQVRDLYTQELDDLQAILSKQPYILGSHPSAADFGYFGSMFRHFSNDPDPAEVMRRRASAVYEWTARLWNESITRLGTQQTWQWPEGDHWSRLLERVAGDYLPYLAANANAWQSGQKRFDFEGQSISFHGTITTQYRVWCREQLRQHYQALDETSRSKVDALFAPYGGLDALTKGELVTSGLEESLRIPREPNPQKRKQGFLRFLFGQARN